MKTIGNTPDYFGNPSSQEPSSSLDGDAGSGLDESSSSDYFGLGEPVGSKQSGGGPRKPWWRQRWVIALGCFVVVAGVGVPFFVGALSSPGRATAPVETHQLTVAPTPESTVRPTSEPTTLPGPTTSTSLASAEPDSTSKPAARGALRAVKQLEVGGEDGWNDYSRGEFGQNWADIDRNGCDQRNDVLKRDLKDVEYRSGTHGCIVVSGTLRDPYSGESINFERGPQTSEEVQIDHVVALADAWHKGAQDWTPRQRERFANDLLNLMASKGEVNQAKSAGDASEWLPPNQDFHCAYVARQLAVKLSYGLRVTARERDAMVGVLSQCPDEPLPVGA